MSDWTVMQGRNVGEEVSIGLIKVVVLYYDITNMPGSRPQGRNSISKWSGSAAITATRFSRLNLSLFPSLPLSFSLSLKLVILLLEQILCAWDDIRRINISTQERSLVIWYYLKKSVYIEKNNSIGSSTTLLRDKWFMSYYISSNERRTCGLTKNFRIWYNILSCIQRDWKDKYSYGNSMKQMNEFHVGNKIFNILSTYLLHINRHGGYTNNICTCSAFKEMHADYPKRLLMKIR